MYCLRFFLYRLYIVTVVIMSPGDCNLSFKAETDSYKPDGFFLNPLIYELYCVYIYVEFI